MEKLIGKVINGLNCCIQTIPACVKCPYHFECRCTDELKKDAFKVIMAYQEKMEEMAGGENENSDSL